MSKSDPDWRSCIYITDPPEDILEKCKKAVTDFTDEVTYEPDARPGVSNMVSIHSNFTGQTPDEVRENTYLKSPSDSPIMFIFRFVNLLKI